MYPRTLLIATALAALVGSLVVYAPLQTLVKLAPQDSPLRSADIEGTLLDGRVTMSTSRGDVVWDVQLQPLYLLTLGLGGNWQMQAEGIAGTGSVVARPWGASVVIDDGEISASRIAAMLGDRSFETSEPLRIQEVSIGARFGAGIVSADGFLFWGPAQVVLHGRDQPVQVPALKGGISTEGDRIVLLVEGAGTPEGAPLMSATLDLPSREVHVVVPGRTLKVLGMSSKFADDKPAFELRQPLR